MPVIEGGRIVGLLKLESISEVIMIVVKVNSAMHHHDASQLFSQKLTPR